MYGHGKGPEQIIVPSLRMLARATERLDRKAVEDYMKPLKSDLLKKLKTGQFYVYGWFDEPKLVSVIPDRLTRHGGDTPLIAPVGRTEVQQATIEEFRRKIEDAIKERRETENEQDALRRENRALQKNLMETNSKLQATLERARATGLLRVRKLIRFNTSKMIHATCKDEV